MPEGAEDAARDAAAGGALASKPTPLAPPARPPETAAETAGALPVQPSALPVRYMVSPLTGSRLPVGAHPGNTGGKKGRSGAKKDKVRHALLDMGHRKALPFLSGLLDGRVPVRFVGTCPSCHVLSDLPAGDELDQLTDAVATLVTASVDARLKASDQAWRYGLGVQKEVSVDNVRERVARTLAIIGELTDRDLAHALITAIEPVWK